MTPDEFLQNITPAAKRSKLRPHSSALFYLRDQGCSLSQLQRYLAAHGVEAAPSTIARFLAATIGHGVDSPGASVKQKTRVAGLAPPKTEAPLQRSTPSPDIAPVPRQPFKCPDDPMSAVDWARDHLAQRQT